MRAFASVATLLALSVGLVAAQSSAGAPAPTSSCAAQNILDACLDSTKPQLEGCTPNDWQCLCDQSTNVLTCYNNCPGHPDQFGAQQTKQSYCNAAKANQPSSSSTLATSASTAAASKTSAESTAAATSASSSETSSSSASKSGSSPAETSKGAAAGLAVEAGSLVAALALGLGVAL